MLAVRSDSHPATKHKERPVYPAFFMCISTSMQAHTLAFQLCLNTRHIHLRSALVLL